MPNYMHRSQTGLSMQFFYTANRPRLWSAEDRCTFYELCASAVPMGLGEHDVGTARQYT